jgi:peptide/nickel transport system substrate-binding protein
MRTSTETSMKTRRVFGGLALLALTPVLAACPGPDHEAAQARQGGTATVISLSDIERPMPLIWESAHDQDLVNLMYMRLLVPIWEGGRIQYLAADRSPMALARGYEYLPPDSSAIRYHLRRDLLWSDSVPVTAHDVVWSYQAYGDPRAASPRQDYLEHIASVTAEDDSTVVFQFHRRYPEMIFHANLAIAPRHVYADHDLGQLRSHPQLVDPVANRKVVNGAFRIGQWNRGQSAILEPNPLFQPRANLDRVVFRVVPEQTTRMVEFQTGRVDMMAGVPYDQLDLIRRMGNVRLERRVGRNYEYIAYNPLTFAPFRDPQVRRALGLAIDVDGLRNALQMEDWTSPAGGPYSPVFEDYYDPQEQAPLPYDPDQAQRILAGLGWTPGTDGILRDAQGQPFRFTLLTNAGNQRRMDVMQIVQQQWRRVGIDVRLQTMETNTFFDRLTQKNFQAAVAGWGVATSPDISTLWRPDNPFNFVSYENPEVLRLFDQAMQQPTEEAWIPYWRQAAALIVRDQPYTWLYFYDEPVAVLERVQGTRIDLMGAYQNMWEWWMTDGARATATMP